jgi:CRISPR system Cascade subunit CasD
MSVLVLRLAGAMQSWGTQSRFSIRDTGREPSKSGVIGLLCAALGKPRDEAVDDGFPTLEILANLKMGVRVNCEGVPQKDFQTAGGAHRQEETNRKSPHRYGVINAKGDDKSTVISYRHYIADADFLVGLESHEEEELLKRLDAAIRRPFWQIFLGRKSFVPCLPVAEGVRDEDLEELLKTYVSPHAARFDETKSLRVVVEAEAAAEMRTDVPLSFAERKFGIRYVETSFVTNPAWQEEANPDAKEMNGSVLIETDA